LVIRILSFEFVSDFGFRASAVNRPFFNVLLDNGPLLHFRYIAY